MSTGWRRQRAFPEGEPSVLLGEFCGPMARGSSKEAAPSAGTARGYSSHAYAAGGPEMPGQSQKAGWTVGVTAPVGPVRGLFRARPWAGPCPSVGRTAP
jgi:hypothetical protein